MPKKVLKIDKFDGGLNNNSLPRDIDPDEVADINNLMVDERGQIRTMGKFEQYISASNIADFTTEQNYNLYTYSGGYDGSGNLTKSDWIVIADSAGGMDIFEEGDLSSAEFTGVLTGYGTSAKMIFHNVDGRLYVNDSNFSNSNTTKVREYIDTEYHSYSGVGERSINAWTDYDNRLIAPTQGANWRWHANPTVSSGTVQHPLVRIDSSGSGTWSITATNFELYYSYMLRDGSETKLKTLTKTTSGLPVSNKELEFKIWITNPTNHTSLSQNISDQYKGVRIYWTITDSIYSNNHQLLVEIDFEKGYRMGTSTYYSQDYEPLEDDTTLNSTTQDFLVDSHTFTNPSDLAHVTYEILNGVAQEDVITDLRYKTSVVANRRVYVGNVKYDAKHFNDRILKSAVNKFSSFAKTDILEVTVNDGDEITALMEYADRLLEFKHRRMNLINISKEFEFLEDVFVGKGCEGPYAVTQTDFGVAWINNNGCYLYDGRNVINLLEERNGKLIKDSTWQSFYQTSSAIGYLPKNRSLIITSDTSFPSAVSDDIYFYHIPTRSWTKGDSESTNMCSNFRLNSTQDLIAIDRGGSGTTTGKLIKWNNNSQDKTITLLTKDIDFGNPATKKHVRKASISFKCPTGNVPTVTYGTNGSSTVTGAFSTGLSTQSDFATVELKPSTAIRDINSFQLKLNGSTDSDFILSDISIIYREKSPR